MWDDNYYKYDDWKQVMTSTYNSLNLNIFPLQGLAGDKYFYQNDGRRIPRGIFPSGSTKLAFDPSFNQGKFIEQAHKNTDKTSTYLYESNRHMLAEDYS